MALLLPTCCLLLEFILLAISDHVFGKMRRCSYQERPQKQTFRKFGYVKGTEQYCYVTNCCVGIYIIKDHSELEVDTLACYLKESSPHLGCQRLNNFLRCICDGDLCNNVTSWTPEGEKLVLLQSSNGVLIGGSIFKKNASLVGANSPLLRPDSKLCWVRDIRSSSPYSILAAGLAMVLIVLCVTVVTLKLFCKKTKSPCTPLDPSCAPTKPLDITDIELQTVLCRGSFAIVWEGRHQGIRVAIKVFPTAGKHAFSAERAVHQLPSMAHPNIVRFLGSGSLGACRIIVLEYATHGSLHSYLSAHSSSWTSCLTLCQSLSQGLSFLHMQGAHKPAVAHGDLSSSNVLVKADGTCALCDFGCSTILCSGSVHHQNRPGQNRRTQAEYGMGTLRYMSPEILEGSVILNISWRLQADVYSLGLVLWEVWMRCSELFGERVPAHLLPYEQELGASVSLKSLLQHVLSLDQRPTIPEAWKQHPQGAALAELLSCCWDSDADARLSAACVVDQLASIQPSTKETSCVLGQFV